MSDTTEAPALYRSAAIPRPRTPSRASCGSSSSPSQADLVVPFAEAFFAKAPPDFLQERSVDALAHVVLGAFRFLQRRGRGAWTRRC